MAEQQRGGECRPASQRRGGPTCHAPVPWLLVALALGALLGGALARPAPPLLAQGGFAVRYEGTFSIGARPAPAGTEVTVITARSATDITICGSGSADRDGHYSVDVQPIPGTCIARNTSEPAPLHIFMVNGENVASDSSSGITLDRPQSLGRTQQHSLRATDVIGLPPGSGIGSAGLIAVRYYGTLYVGDLPARAGSVVTVISARDASNTTVCGTGTVSDDQGNYYVDVQPIPGTCVARTASEPAPLHIFMVNGENVASDSSSGIQLERPASLARTQQQSLRATAIPGLQTADAPLSSTFSGTLIGVRYYGTVRIGDQLAPTGTEVAVTSDVDGSECGRGTVLDDLGTYYVDVEPIADRCVASDAGARAPLHIILVNGVNVAADSSSGIQLNRPASLARTQQHSLQAPEEAACPSGRLQGHVCVEEPAAEPTPPEECPEGRLEGGVCMAEPEPEPTEIEALPEPTSAELPSQPTEVELPPEPTPGNVPPEPTGVEAPAEPTAVEIPPEPTAGEAPSACPAEALGPFEPDAPPDAVERADHGGVLGAPARGLLGTTAATRQEVPANQAGAGSIMWQADRPLQWADFRGTPPPGTSWAAETSSAFQPSGTPAYQFFGYRVNPRTTATGGCEYVANVPIHFNLTHAWFDATKSWAVRSRASASVLKHEQGHFDITEIQVRKARNLLGVLLGVRLDKDGKGTLQVTCAKANDCIEKVKAVQKLIRDNLQTIVDEWNRLQEDYDRETDHGAIAEKQAEWENKIQAWLALYPWVDNATLTGSRTAP